MRNRESAHKAYVRFVEGHRVPNGTELDKKLVAWREERRARRANTPPEKMRFGITKEERSAAATADLSIGY